MPKRLPPNNRPWPSNLLYDFSLPEAVSPADAEAFISTLPTSDRNKEFLFLRYQEGKTYNEIANKCGLTATGVRLAVKNMWEKFSPDPHAAPPTPTMPTLVTDVKDLVPQSAATSPTTPVITPAAAPPAPPVANVVRSANDEQSVRPLSINLASVRRLLNLTPEEFSRPISIEDGEALITRLETGFSRPSATVLDIICEAWGVSRSYLLTGQGEIFEEGSGYCDALVRLLQRYLSVATFDRQGNQYWKGCLVDDLGRLIDVGQLSGREMCRVVRTLYDYLDVEQFSELLERMGR